MSAKKYSHDDGVFLLRVSVVPCMANLSKRLPKKMVELRNDRVRGGVAAQRKNQLIRVDRPLCNEIDTMHKKNKTNFLLFIHSIEFRKSPLNRTHHQVVERSENEHQQMEEHTNRSCCDIRNTTRLSF